MPVFRIYHFDLFGEGVGLMGQICALKIIVWVKLKEEVGGLRNEIIIDKREDHLALEGCLFL